MSSNTYDIVSHIIEKADKNTSKHWNPAFLGGTADTLPAYFSDALALPIKGQSKSPDMKDFNLLFNGVMAIRALSMYIYMMFPDTFMPIAKIVHEFIKYLIKSHNDFEFNSKLAKQLLAAVSSIKVVRNNNKSTRSARRSGTRKLTGGARSPTLLNLLQKIFLAFLLILSGVEAAPSLKAPETHGQLALPRIIKNYKNPVSTELYSNVTMSQDTVGYLSKWMIASGFNITIGENGISWGVEHGQLGIFNSSHSVGRRGGVFIKDEYNCGTVANSHYHPFAIMNNANPESEADWVGGFMQKVFNTDKEIYNHFIITQAGLIVLQPDPQTMLWITNYIKSFPKHSQETRRSILNILFRTYLDKKFKQGNGGHLLEPYEHTQTYKNAMWNPYSVNRTLEITVSPADTGGISSSLLPAVGELFDFIGGNLTFTTQVTVHRWADLHAGKPIRIANIPSDTQASCKLDTFHDHNNIRHYTSRTNAEYPVQANEMVQWVDNILTNPNIQELYQLLIKGDFKIFQAQRKVFATLLMGISKNKKFKEKWGFNNPETGHGRFSLEHSITTFPAARAAQHEADADVIMKLFMGCITGTNTDPSLKGLAEEFHRNIWGLMTGKTGRRPRRPGTFLNLFTLGNIVEQRTAETANRRRLSAEAYAESAMSKT
jgi:hypothetical protein